MAHGVERKSVLKCMHYMALMGSLFTSHGEALGSTDLILRPLSPLVCVSLPVAVCLPVSTSRVVVVEMCSVSVVYATGGARDRLKPVPTRRWPIRLPLRNRQQHVTWWHEPESRLPRSCHEADVKAMARFFALRHWPAFERDAADEAAQK